MTPPPPHPDVLRSEYNTDVHFISRSEPHSGPPISVFKALPEVWDLIRPRRALLALGFVLMVINRLTALVLPASTKFLVDDVIGKHRAHLLVPLVGAVLVATLVQGVTSSPSPRLSPRPRNG